MAMKGRNIALILQRNKRLAARYYFYANLNFIAYEKVLQLLSVEFELSEIRIGELISQNMHLVSSFEKQQISVSRLKEAYPFMDWKPMYQGRTLCSPAQLSLDLSE